MSTRRQPIPPQWQELMDRKGIPSLNRLCEVADLGFPTVHRVVRGSGKRPSDDTMRKLAEALGVDPKVIYELADRPVEHAQVWEPPGEAMRLTPKQRKVVEDLIKVMVEDNDSSPTETVPESQSS